MSVLLIAICLIVGTLIGAVGIGGVLLVPSLAFLADIEVHRAIPACMFSYLATGAVAAFVFARHGSIQWSNVGWLCLGAVPAAFLGATALLSIPAEVVKALIAILMLTAGWDALRTRRKDTTGDVQISPAVLICMGGVTGFGSSITGTGGPLVLVPLAMTLGVPVLTAVGLSQAVQVPIATFASIGNWTEGNLDISLGMAIAVSMVVGTLVGASLIHHLPLERVKKGVAILLLVVGASLGGAALVQFVSGA